MNDTRQGELAKVYRTVAPWTYSILGTFIVAGLGLLSSFMCHRDIRRYSSMVYLTTMIASDVLIVIGRFFPSVVLSSIPDFEFDDIICKAFSGIFFFGRAGTSVSVVLLAIERNAALSFPNRFQGLHTPKAAMLISLVAATLLIPVAFYASLDTVWDERRQSCGLSVAVTGERTPQLPVRLSLTVMILALQVIFNLTLLISMIRKRKNRVVDPIHSTISAARQNNKQLNKINFISLIMCVNCLLLNFLIFVIVVVVRRDSGDMVKVLRSILIVELLCLLNLASRVPTLILVSNRLRVEFVSMLKCNRHVGKRIDPRQIALKGKKTIHSPDSTAKQAPITIANSPV